MIEHRQYLRTPSNATVVMSHPGFGTISVPAKDLSEGGISVDLSQHFRPPVGTIVDVLIKRYTGAINATPVKMQVRHIQLNGTVGLAFV